LYIHAFVVLHLFHHVWASVFGLCGRCVLYVYIHSMNLALHESEDIVRGVLSELQSNRDLLHCDLVCKRWKGLQQPLPQPAYLTADQAMQKTWLCWLARNAIRLNSLTLSGQPDSAVCNKLLWPLLSEAQGLQQLRLQNYKTLTSLPPVVANLTSLRELFISCSNSSSSSNSNSSSDSDSGTAANDQANGSSSSSNSSRHFQPLCGLQELPEEIGALQQLQRLELLSCSALCSLPDGISCCSSLTAVSRQGTIAFTMHLYES
jgi:hypothetical protein